MRRVGFLGALRCKDWIWGPEDTFLPERRRDNPNPLPAPATRDAKAARRSSNDVYSTLPAPRPVGRASVARKWSHPIAAMLSTGRALETAPFP